MELILILEIIGTIAFAMSGAMLAILKNMDYYGIVFSAIITSVGGGVVRDIIINQNLPIAFSNPIYIIISIITAGLTIIFYKQTIYLYKILNITDTIGLGIFTAIGVQVAILNDVSQPIVIIIIAILTGTGGGAIRDVFAKEIPFVFHREIYAVASMLGAVLYLILNKYIGNEVAFYGCFSLVVIIRWYCLKNNIHLKKVS